MSRKVAVDSVSRVDYLYESSQSSTSRRLVQTSRHVRVERLKKLGEYKYDASSRGRPNPFFPLLTWTRPSSPPRAAADLKLHRRRPHVADLKLHRRLRLAPLLAPPAPRAILLILPLAPILAPPAQSALIHLKNFSSREA